MGGHAGRSGPANRAALNPPGEAAWGESGFSQRPQPSLYPGFVANEDSFPFTVTPVLAGEGAGNDSGRNEWAGFGYDQLENVKRSASTEQPMDYALHEAQPNPFNPATTVRVSLPEASELTVRVFNAMGREVAELADGEFSAGVQSFTLDGSELASGLYFVRASVPGEFSDVQKVTLMK